MMRTMMAWAASLLLVMTVVGGASALGSEIRPLNGTTTGESSRRWCLATHSPSCPAAAVGDLAHGPLHL